MTEKPRKSSKAAKQASRGGRPRFKPTIEQRETVEQMKFCGESDATIARALRIDADTLRKHFADELADGHAQRRQEIIGLLFTAAKQHNVAAIKKLEEMGRLAGAAEAVARREPKVPEPGKKEQQQAAAERVGSKFAPPAPPKLVVSNT